MRRRRAERLAIRAEAAVAAGQLEEARTCFEEAKALAPALPQLALVEQKLAVPPPSESRPRTRLPWIAGFTAAAILLVAIPSWLAVRQTPKQAQETPSAVELAPPPSASSETPQTASETPRTAETKASAESAPAPSAVFARETSAAAAALDRAAVPTAPTAPDGSKPQPAPAARTQDLPAPPLPPVESPARSAEPPLPRVTAPRSEPPPTVSGPTIPTTDAAPLSTAARVGTTELPVAPPAAPPAPVPAATPAAPAAELARPDVPQEAAVRTVLNRYASAYSALDADAAGRVWPGVNRAALSRAFDNLASQQISLGDCRIDVAGSSARANCTGSATWSPKVGDGGTHREARRWTFELARAGDSWQIVSARVQNR